MKLIIAFIKPYRLEEIRDAMNSLGVDSFSFSEVRGIGHHKGERDIYRGVEYACGSRNFESLVYVEEFRL